jgi:hypothetical protein
LPDVQEVFHMATQKIRPDPGGLEGQHGDQPRPGAKNKAAVFVLIAALVVGGVVFGISALRDGDAVTVTPASSPTPTGTSIPTLPIGPLAAGTYVFATLHSDFDALHRITIDVPDGFEAPNEGTILKIERASQHGVSAWVIGDVYADPCRWSSTRMDPPPVSSVDDLVAALASQRGVRASTPTDITFSGFAGKHMERTVPAGTNLDECNGAQFRLWLGTDGGERYVEPRQHDLLWIVDVDGVPLLFDAALGKGTTAQDRAELIQMVDSIRIETL